MLSPRGTWFLIAIVLVFVIGAFAIPYFSVVPALVALTLLLWFCSEWVLFQLRSNAAVSRLKLHRHVLQGGREVPMVWAGLGFEVHLDIENPSRVGIPFAVLEDRPVVATERVSGSAQLFTPIPAQSTISITYTLKAPSAGVLRFEGLKLRVADLHGFFYRRVFLRNPVEFLVLPPLTDDEGRQRATKRFNTLPPPGIHRLRRPGSGSELLDLRDYRPGDQPKMIAWKASARRDRLITKEFENDVPVRCVLFLDTSQGVRLGPPGNTLLTRLGSVAGAVAQAAAANRDIVGLTTFDEVESKGTLPARTKIHMINMLRRLAEASSLQPGVAGVAPEQLTRRAYPLAQDLYPELMSRKVNSMPLGRLWIPLLDRKWGFLALIVIVINLILVYFFRDWRFDALNSAGRNTRLAVGNWSFFPKLLFFGAMVAWHMFWPIILTGLFWFFHSFRGWFGNNRKELTRRKQLAAVFALQDGTGADGVERYVMDDDSYATRVAAFLQQHQIRCPIPLYDEKGVYRFRCEAKAPVLANAMMKAVGHARDNELYVILADLAELGKQLAPIVRACQVARARHHHLLVIVPWPADVPSPDEPEEVFPVVAEEFADDDSLPSGKAWKAFKRSARNAKGRDATLASIARKFNLVQIVRRSLTKQYHESFRTLRRELGRVGATVVRVNDGDAVQIVLDRLDRLRGMRSRR